MAAERKPIRLSRARKIRSRLRRDVRALMSDILDEFVRIGQPATAIDAIIDVVYMIPKLWRQFDHFGDPNDILNRERILRVHRTLDSIKHYVRAKEREGRKRAMYATRFRRTFPEGFNTVGDALRRARGEE